MKRKTIWKRILSVALVLLLALSFTVSALADEAAEAAETGALTRGELVQALYELSMAEKGEELAELFSDVPSDSGLATAINWAVGAKVVFGYGDGTFGPEDPVTREQMAAMIYRYAQAEGKGFQGMWMFPLDYPDAGEIASYADEAMHWVVMHEILPATEAGLEPKAGVDKEQLGLILERCEAALRGEGEEPAPTEEPAPEKEDLVLTNGEWKLTIPAEYTDLLIAEATEAAEDGTLFTVAEKASVEAAAAQGETAEGAGWLFAIGRIDEERLHELLCGDMSGIEAFAKDENGNHFVFCHPTDVRFVRESYEGIDEDMAQWAALNEWAGTMKEAFLAENEGLTAESYGNTILDMYLSRIAYKGDVNYTISTTEFGPLEPGDVDAAPFLAKLMNGVTYTYTEGEAPDGEYVVLTVSEDGERFDFFRGNETCIRRVMGEYEELYTATFADGETTSTGVMSAWYDALAVAAGKK